MTEAEIDRFLNAYAASTGASEEAGMLELCRDRVVYDAHLAGASYSELASRLGFSISRVRQMVIRARESSDD